MSIPAESAARLASADERWAAWRKGARYSNGMDRRKCELPGALLALALILALGVYGGML
jgi:hypothetical protein